MNGNGPRMRGIAAAAFAAIASMAIATAALAGGATTAPRVNPDVQPMTVRPITASSLPLATFAPNGGAPIRRGLPQVRCTNINWKALRAGSQVPISCFPRLPAKTAANTATPHATAKGSRYHPMAATGATIDLTAGAGCGTQGALYSVGCSLTWIATNNADWSASDTFADYELAPNATTATQVGANYTTATSHTTTLSAAGTYAFFVYDTTQQVIVSIVYVNAGQAFSIGVYQDPYHTSPQYQYNVNTSSAAYIYLPDVSTNDTYVVYVESTSINTFCVYVTPNSTPAPYSPSPPPTGAPNALICNPANSPGIAAPSGQLSLTWSFANSYPAGTYSIVVYDKTAGQTLGQVQVSLTGFQQYGFVLFPTPAAAPTPAAPATPSNVNFAWDSATDQSTGGIVATVPNQLGNGGASQTYRMTATDPDGQVVFVGNTNAIPSTCTLANNTSATCTATATFQFSAATPTLNSPGTYPNNIWTMQLYNPTTKVVEASQAFQIMGYSLQTEFVVGTTTQQSLTWIVGTSANLPASMVFKNTGNINYPNAADPVQGIEYTTGPAATLTNAGGFKPPSGTTGYGITAALTGCTGAYNTIGCSKTEPDTSGNSWTVTVYCSTNAVTAPSLTDQCVITLFPQNQATLTATNSITVPGLTFYMQGNQTNWSCFAVPCTTTTSILPADGLSWSSTSGTANSWTPVYFDALNATLDVAAQEFYIGAVTVPATNRSTVTAPFATNPPSPPPNTHYYQSIFAQGDYQSSTPYALTSGREDIMVINLVGCTGNAAPVSGCTSNLAYNAGEVGITFPSSINAANITVDPNSPKVPTQNYYYGNAVGIGTGAGNTCIAQLPPNSICLNPGASTPGGTNGNNTTNGIFSGDITQIYLDVPAATSSFTSQEMEIQVWDSQNFGWSALSTTGYVENPTIGGGAGGPIADSLSLQAFSLNSNLMAAQFNPSTVSPNLTNNTTSYSLTFANTTTAADPNPDPVDALVIEQATSTGWTISGTPTVTGPTGWSYLTNVSPAANTLEYLFGLTACTAQKTNFPLSALYEPAQPPTGPTYPTAYQDSLGQCTLGQEDNAIAAGGSATINFTLNNTSTGSQTFYVYAHGANGGGWSAPKVVTVTSSALTASAKFFSTAQGATDASCVKTSNVATNTVAQVSKSPNCFIYEVTNTSSAGTQNIATTSIALPAFDINGLATNSGDWTLVGSPINTYVALGTISGGTFVTTGIPAGCTITLANITNPTPGSTNGAITVTGCTGFTGGTNIAVEFVANTPSVESDSYLLPTTINGVTSGVAWTGSDEVSVAFSLGLAISVDPANPGPGNSHPNVVCNPAQCTFSGETVNFGEFGANTTITGTDVVRATVIYEGSSVTATCPAGAGVVANTWQLQVAATANATTELNTAVDETNSSSGLTYGTGVGTYFEPTNSVTTLACGNYTASTDYDVLQNFRIENGTDVSGHQVTITYTLIGN